MVGPSGSGKTYLVQNLAKLLGVPFTITDATSLTESGYVGADVETVLQKLIAAADGYVRRAEHINKKSEASSPEEMLILSSWILRQRRILIHPFLTISLRI